MRILVLWCPDWPVVAALTEAGESDMAPAAVLSANRVVACNAAARADGIRRGMRRRDAQARCPGLRLLPAGPDRDAREFEPVLAAVEELRPGVAAIRPGLLAIRSPARFYGGEERAAATLLEAVVGVGVRDVRAGIADEVFTAEQAARRAGVQDWVVVPEGGSPAFLAPLPVEAIDDADLAGLLRRLGLTTLADLAALPAGDVLTRFGASGARLHRLASGRDPAQPATRTPPPDLVREIGFEPPLASVEAVCFSVRTTCEELLAALAERGLVATAVRIEAEGDGADSPVVSSRSWLHSGFFGVADLVDRVHWQLGADLSGQVLGSPVGRMRFVPETVEPAAAHAEGLWGGGAEERVDRGVARVQAMLGYDAVVVPVRQGGRSPADRQALVPWGERPSGLRPPVLPWPGSIPPPAPTRVFAEPWPTVVLGETGRPVAVTERGAVTDPPARVRLDRRWLPVEAWAGPWPVSEQWWEGAGALVARFQIVAADGTAWLLRCQGDRDTPQWVVEAAYE